PLFPQQWGMSRIGAPQAWDTADGTPVVVAVVDTGVDVSHPDLAAATWTNPGEVPGNGVDDDGNGYVDDVRGWDVRNGDATVYDDPSSDAHGTHVAGIVAAVRGNGTGVAGVAAARIMPVKFISGGTGSISDAVTALRYARDNGARIVNASFGSSGYSTALCDAVADITASGVLVVSAAGNSAVDNDVQRPTPAACPAPGNVAVAATTSTDALASYSNRGAATVDLAAPGSAVLSTIPGGYGTMSGTSMAAPHVAGAAAAVLARAPSLGPAEVRAALVDGGAALPALAGMTQAGTLLSLPGALARVAAPAAAATPPAPFALLTPADGAVSAEPRPVFTWQEAVDAGGGTAGYRVVIDGADAAQVGAGALTWRPAAALADGSHTWRVDARDSAGNVRSSAARTVAVDTTPPEPFTVTSAAVVDTPSAAVTWSAARDATSGVARYEVAAGGATATLPPTQTSWTLPFPVPASPTPVTVRAVDAAGNVRTAAGPIAYLPPTPPPAPRAATPLGGTVGRRPVLRWSPAQPGNWGLAGVRVILDGAAVADLPPSATAWTPVRDLAPG
ncbi:MAG: S8 family serine peptidase, partial [Actinomycetota bacterium]